MSRMQTMIPPHCHAAFSSSGDMFTCLCGATAPHGTGPWMPCLSTWSVLCTDSPPPWQSTAGIVRAIPEPQDNGRCRWAVVTELRVELLVALNSDDGVLVYDEVYPAELCTVCRFPRDVENLACPGEEDEVIAELGPRQPT